MRCGDCFRCRSSGLLQRCFVRCCKNHYPMATDGDEHCRSTCWWTGKYDHIMPVLCDTLQWLPIQQRIEFKVAVLAFDCVRGTCPSYYCVICTPLTEVGGRVRLRSAHRGNLCVPSTRTEFGKRSFRVAAPRTRNSLPLHLRSSTISRQQFQSGLKTHLFKRAYI